PGDGHLLLHARAPRDRAAPHQPAAGAGGVRGILRGDGAPLCAGAGSRGRRPGGGIAVLPWSPNFSWIAPDLAVGGCFPPERAASLAGEHGIGAVIDARAEACDDA